MQKKIMTRRSIKRVSGIVVALLTYAGLQANAADISGKVARQNNDDPVDGVLVSAEYVDKDGLKKHSTSNTASDGSYRLSVPDSDLVTVTYSKVGYRFMAPSNEAKPASGTIELQLVTIYPTTRLLAPTVVAQLLLDRASSKSNSTTDSTRQIIYDISTLKATGYDSKELNTIEKMVYTNFEK